MSATPAPMIIDSFAGGGGASTNFRPPLRVLIGCETSGRVRRAFAALGHDAWSCDLLPAEDGSNRHLVGDIRDYLDMDWDLLAVMHPPCTRLCKSGLRWLHQAPAGRTLDEMWSDLDEAADLFSACWNAPIPHRAIENPRMHRHAQARIVNYRPPVQIVQPWQFGDPAFKATCLYLSGLMPLRPTDELTPPARNTLEWKKWSLIHRMPGNRDRRRERSITFPGLAAAMAMQWGGITTKAAALARANCAHLVEDENLEEARA